MEISKEFYKLIERLEGKIPKVYLDSGGEPTIGIGHLLTKSERLSGKIIINGVPVKYSYGLTDEQINDLTRQDVSGIVVLINNLVKVPLNPYQFDTLVSFTFNVGNTAFKNSTLLKVLNKGMYTAVPAQLRRWRFDNGNEVPGLVNRREKEIAHWLRK